MEAVLVAVVTAILGPILVGFVLDWRSRRRVHGLRVENSQQHAENGKILTSLVERIDEGLKRTDEKVDHIVDWTKGHDVLHGVERKESE